MKRFITNKMRDLTEIFCWTGRNIWCVRCFHLSVGNLRENAEGRAEDSTTNLQPRGSKADVGA